MRPAGYTRLVSDSDGGSSFEACEVALTQGFAVPPAEPLHMAPFMAGSSSLVWMGAPSDWKGTEVHPAPQRMVFIAVSGEYEVTTSDGNVQRFSAGSVLLIEDTQGRGHSTRIIGPDDAVVLAVMLPAS